MKKQRYHQLTLLFFTLTILLFVIVGFLMSYSNGVFTLGSFQTVIVEQKQDPIPQPSPSQLKLPISPSDMTHNNPNGVSNRVKHWNETTHKYETTDNISQYIYSISTQTTLSTQIQSESANEYVTPMGHQERIMFTVNSYNNGIQKIEHAIYQQVQSHGTPVTYSITYEYKNKDAIRPMYIRIEVYTPHDNGNTINWNVLLYNNLP